MKSFIAVLILSLAAMAVDTPVFTDKELADIATAQKNQAIVQRDRAKLDSDYQRYAAQLDQQSLLANKATDDAIEKAFTAHKLKHEDWTLDQNNVLQPKPNPPKK